MTSQEKIKELAILDGYKWTGVLLTKDCRSFYPDSPPYEVNYLESYDAILPLIQKQPMNIMVILEQKCSIFETPSELSDALLIATGRMNKNKPPLIIENDNLNGL